LLFTLIEVYPLKAIRQDPSSWDKDSDYRGLSIHIRHLDWIKHNKLIAGQIRKYENEGKCGDITHSTNYWL